MENLYNYMSTIDMESLKQDSRFLMSYEENKLHFIICDENFEKVYVSQKKKNEERAKIKINNRIVKRINSFQPEFKTRISHTKIKGKGIITQGQHTYYVYIYENKIGVKIHFSYLKLFFGIICIVALVISIGLSCIISNRISRPIRNIEKNTKKSIDNGFNVDLDENQEFKELSGLAKSINIIMKQIRDHIDDLEKEIEHKTMVEESRRQFVNNVSHEMKTPLAIISSQVEMLELIDNEEKRHEYCKSIIQETTDMSEMINEMILIYSMQNDNETMAMEVADISELVSVSCERYEDLFQNNNVALHKEIETGCRAKVNVRFLSQAVENYITNSIKHSKKNGRVFVRVMQNDDYVRIEVENDGEAIPEEDKEKIWNKFYRGDTVERLNGQKGSGLGLYLVKSIVEIHHGNYGYKNLKHSVLFYMELPK